MGRSPGGTAGAPASGDTPVDTSGDIMPFSAFTFTGTDFGGFNAVYAGYCPKDPPARTTAEARLMIDIKVEIEAIAYKPL